MEWRIVIRAIDIKHVPNTTTVSQKAVKDSSIQHLIFPLCFNDIGDQLGISLAI